MHLDVVEIRDFYQRRLGQIVRRLVSRQIRGVWPHAKGMTVGGIGYATPYLRPFLRETDRVSALCPAGQGAIIWPKESPYRTLLVDEDMFPMVDEVYDRIIEVHGLEFFADANAHLAEIWRVLKPEGRVLLVVPNRRGVWARIDSTPFGNGQPFSRGQLQDLLIANRLRPLRFVPMVHFAPFETALRLFASPAIEKIGMRVWPHFSGLLMVEAIKDVTQPIRPHGLKVERVKKIRVTANPVPARVSH